MSTCSARRFGFGLVITGWVVLTHAFDGSGLTVDSSQFTWPYWQGRMSMAAAPAWGDGYAARGQGSPRLGSLSLMGDYYLGGSLLGRGTGGGFRATSGVMIGPRSAAWAGPVSASTGVAVSPDRRVFGQAPAVLSGDPSSENPTLPYFGIGYTGLSSRGGWSFSADLGMVSLSPGDAVKFGRVFTGTQSLDDTVRDMRWSPVLQLGVSYSF